MRKTKKNKSKSRIKSKMTTHGMTRCLERIEEISDISQAMGRFNKAKRSGLKWYDIDRLKAKGKITVTSAEWDTKKEEEVIYIGYKLWCRLNTYFKSRNTQTTRIYHRGYIYVVFKTSRRLITCYPCPEDIKDLCELLTSMR